VGKNIVLTGFMGAGKSIASNTLAKRLNRKVVSTDVLIEKKENRVIADIFRDSGEDYFRKVEGEVVAQVSKKSDLIIDCGGGVVLSEENMSNLRKNGAVIYLKTSPEVVFERTKKETHRPLLQTENPLEKINELLEKRKPFYEKAEYIIETDHKTNDQVCDEIVGIISNE